MKRNKCSTIILCFIIFVFLKINAQEKLPSELTSIFPKAAQNIDGSFARDTAYNSFVTAGMTANVPDDKGCEKEVNTLGQIHVHIHSWNANTVAGKYTLQMLSAQLDNSFAELKSEMQSAIENEKQGPMFLRTGNVIEETIKGGKAFYYEVTHYCVESYNTEYPSIYFRSRSQIGSTFVTMIISFAGDKEKVKNWANEILSNIEKIDFSKLM